MYFTLITLLFIGFLSINCLDISNYEPKDGPEDHSLLVKIIGKKFKLNYVEMSANVVGNENLLENTDNNFELNRKKRSPQSSGKF